jgi:hypothetical protein
MKENPFKDKNILLFLHPVWCNGSSYKFTEYLKKEFGINSTETKDGEKIDLGICFGDLFTEYQKPLKRGIPYLLVEHDVTSLRFGLNRKACAYEREKIENAVAIIFTSEDHALYYEKLKKEQGWHIPEYIVIHNKPLKKDIEFIPKKKLIGNNLVYAGGIVNRWEDKNSTYHYRAYHHIFRKFIEAGWRVHIYPANIAKTHLTQYKDIGCILYDKIDNNKIYEEMSQYTAGLHSYNRIDTPELAFQYTQTCRPNRLYDYLASGIPTIGYDGGNGMEIYRDKWGIVIDDLEPETLKAIPERLKKIKITQKMRKDNVLERERSKFEYIIYIALKEAGNTDRKRYYNTENPFIKNDLDKYPNRIKVFNKGVISIYRGGYLFLPGKTSVELEVNMRTYKEIKSHVSLRIENIG